MKSRRRLIVIVLSAFLFIFIWFKEYVANWNSADASAPSQKFQFRWDVEGGEQFQSVVQSSKLLENCFGFEGECRLEQLGVILKLNFSGLKIRKPTYILFSLMGGMRGWRLIETFYGLRKLSITKIDGTSLGEFTQTIWNTSGYSDFSQILFINLAKREIMVSSTKYGFNSVHEDGYVVRY